MKYRIPVAAAVVLIGALSLSFTVHWGQDAKLPVPDAASQKEAEQLIREVFEKEYAKRSPADRQALAEVLIRQGIDTRDDQTARFVLFREARDIAADAGDPTTMLRAIGEMDARFKIDADSMKLAALQRAGKKAKTPAQSKEMALAYLKLAEAAAKSGDFDTATQAGNAAASFARRSKDLRLATRAIAKSKEIADLRKSQGEVQKARETLSKNPFDGAANTVVGRFLCMVQGEWERGLPYLRLGSDKELKALAEMDFEGAPDAVGKARIGDRWWNLGEQESGILRENLRRRAAGWYRKAIGGLSGLRKVRIEKRLEQVGALPLKETGASWVDVTHGELFGVNGERGEAIKIIAPSNGTKVLVLKEFPDGDYDAISARIHVGSSRSVHGVLVFERVGRSVTIDTTQAKLLAEHFEDGNWVNDGRSKCSRRGSYVLTVVIEGGDYVASVDGKEKLRVRTRQTRITYLALKADLGQVVFDQIKLRKKR